MTEDLKVSLGWIVQNDRVAMSAFSELEEVDPSESQWLFDSLIQSHIPPLHVQQKILTE